MSSGRHSYSIIYCFVFLILASGCSVEKNTGASRFYHGLTARYNIYFNGYESYRAGVDKVNRAHKDDFGEILPVFEYSNPASAQVASADMERAIQKASKLITLKSITARPEKKDNQPLRDEDFYNLKEYNRWVDDSYLLMAKARFYQKDYNQSRATIVFNNENSTDNAIKTEGSIWLARIHSETGNYTEALRVLSETGSPESITSSSLRSMYYSTQADILLKQKRYSEAIEPLSRAIAGTKAKHQKYRLTYLLAQLYGEVGQPDQAIELFSEVIKMRPPYEVEFNARIGMATVYDASAGSSEKIRSELISMIRDDKNKDYLDQIYYALGKLSEKEGDMESAIDYYKKAGRSTGTTGNGRGRAYLALAGYYFDIPDYLNAKNFYDSAIAFLDRQYPDYELITSKSANLNELVTQLEIVRIQDSLRRVAAMTEQERTLLISGIIQKVREEELAMTQAGSSDMFNLGQYYENERRFRDNIEAEGQWYFYNQAAMTFGRSEFRRRWGERKLEDNWRRQNKRIVQGGDQQDAEGQAVADTALSATDPKSPEYYLRDLPLTDSLMAISREKTVNALFAAGRVYADRFADIPKAGASWTDLTNRFPDHDLVPQTYYQLYLLYRENEPSKAETYRQTLLARFPDSDFALILTDPDYFRRMRAAELETARLYEEAYNIYVAGNYEQAAAICEMINKTTPGHELIPKVRLLYSLTLAGRGDERSYRENLSAIVKEFPGTEEAKRAADLMGVIDREMPELRVEEDRQIAAEIYIHEPEGQHLFVLLIENPAFNVNQATFDVINYNIDNYTNRNFRAEGALIDNKFILLTVSRFNSKDDAMEYYRNFDALAVIRNSSPATTKTFIITNRNLETLRTDKDPARYILFFREKYLNGNETR